MKILIYILKSFIYLTPLPILNILAGFIAKLLVYFLKRERKIAYSQINFVYGQNIDKKKLLEKSYKNSILSLFEILQVESIFKIKKISPSSQTYVKEKLGDVVCEDVDILQDLVSCKQNALCLTSHYSNFDLLAAFFSYQGVKMSVAARAANNENFQAVLDEIRTGYGVDMLWRNSKDSTALLKAIKSKSMICALIDQDVNLENYFSPFFGLEAAYPAAPIKIALRFNMPIILGVIKRIKLGEYRIFLERIYWEDKEEKEAYILSKYGEILEKHINEDPTQWVWWHRRWRRRPGINYEKNPELLISTYDYIEWIKSKRSS